MLWGVVCRYVEWGFGYIGECFGAGLVGYGFFYVDKIGV